MHPLYQLLDFIIEAQVYSTVFMTGLIWLIQLVHYPSFHFINKENFTSFEAFHSRTITYIVLPIMLVELLSAFFLIILFFEKDFILSSSNLISVIFLWFFTLLISARIHKQLHAGYNKKLVDKLISTNWVRTILWSSRSILVFYFLNAL